MFLYPVLQDFAIPPGLCYLMQVWAWTVADSRSCSLTKPHQNTLPFQHPAFSPALQQPNVSKNFYNVWTDLSKQVV